jgi:hypothetical protein
MLNNEKMKKNLFKRILEQDGLVCIQVEKDLGIGKGVVS